MSVLKKKSCGKFVWLTSTNLPLLLKISLLTEKKSSIPSPLKSATAGFLKVPLQPQSLKGSPCVSCVENCKLAPLPYKQGAPPSKISCLSSK